MYVHKPMVCQLVVQTGGLRINRVCDCVQREKDIQRDEREGRGGRGTEGRGKKLINTLHAEDLKGRFGDEVSMNFKEHKKG